MKIDVTCHELGHILGQVTLKDTGVSQSNMLNDGVEGEADFFGGACLFKFILENGHERVPDHEVCVSRFNGELGTCSWAVQISISTMDKIYRRNINYLEALQQKFEGINRTYPSAECRLLSVINGILEIPRPACWYNSLNYSVNANNYLQQ